MIFGGTTDPAIQQAVRDGHAPTNTVRKAVEAGAAGKGVALDDTKIAQRELRRARSLSRGSIRTKGGDVRSLIASNHGGLRTAADHYFSRSAYDPSPRQWGNSSGGALYGLGEGNAPAPLVVRIGIAYDVVGGKVKLKFLPDPSRLVPLFLQTERYEEAPVADFVFVSFANIDRPILGAKTAPPYQFVVASWKSQSQEVYFNKTAAVAAKLITAAEWDKAVGKLRGKATSEAELRKGRLFRQDQVSAAENKKADEDAARIQCTENLVHGLGVPPWAAKLWCKATANPSRALALAALGVIGLVAAPSVIRIFHALREKKS